MSWFHLCASLPDGLDFLFGGGNDIFIQFSTMGFIIITSPFLGICLIFASQLNWDSKDLRQPEKPPRRWKKKDKNQKR